MFSPQKADVSFLFAFGPFGSLFLFETILKLLRLVEREKKHDSIAQAGQKNGLY